MPSKKLPSIEENEVPVKAYNKAELAGLYGVSPFTFHKWLVHWEKELKKLKYTPKQRILTVAQVAFLFKDDVLGKP